MKQPQPSLTASYSLVQSSFWMNFCTAVSFASVYLLGLGYSNSSLGIVLAAGNLLGAVLGTELSSQIDRSEKLTASSLMLPLLILQCAAVLPLLLFPVKSAATVVSYTLYICFTIAVNSLNLKLYTDALHHGCRIDYGFARGLGSSAYVLLSMLLGVIIEGTSIRSVPLFGLLLGLLQMLAFSLIRRKLPADASSPGKTDQHGVSLPVFVGKNRKFTVLLCGIALLFFAHNIVVNFLINITRFVGGDTSTMGLINGFMAAVEIPVLLLYERLFSGKDPAKLLRIAFVFFFFKSIAIALSRTIPTLSAAFLLQAPSFALEAAAIVPYVDQAIRYEDSAKAQSLAFTMTTVGSVLASMIGGVLYDRAGVGNTLWISCAICACGSAIALLGMETKGEPDRQADILK